MYYWLMGDGRSCTVTMNCNKRNIMQTKLLHADFASCIKLKCGSSYKNVCRKKRCNVIIMCP